MSARTPIVERAFQLARSGTYRTVSDVKTRLKAEGYACVDGELYGTSLHRSLRDLCVAARASKAEPVS